MTGKHSRRFGPARIHPLDQKQSEDLSASTTAVERLEMVAVLSNRMLELRGMRLEPMRRDVVQVRRLRP